MGDSKMWRRKPTLAELLGRNTDRGFMLQTLVAGHGMTLQESKNDFLLKFVPIFMLQTPEDLGRAGLRLPSGSQMGLGEEVNWC